MSSGDYFGSEIATTVDPKRPTFRIELVEAGGRPTVLKAKTPLDRGRDHRPRRCMSRKALRRLLRRARSRAAKKDGILFSLHVKATMMKIADPIVFGHVVSVFFSDVVEKHAATLKKLGVNLNNGFGDLLTKIETLPEAEKKAIKDDIAAEYAKRPALAMVNSDKGHYRPACAQRLHHRRLDPAMIRESGACGARMASCTTPRPSFPIVPTRGCSRRSSRTARPMAPSTQRPWARFRTLA
jgi:isocitrate dehydrogenase